MLKPHESLADPSLFYQKRSRDKFVRVDTGLVEVTK